MTIPSGVLGPQAHRHDNPGAEPAGPTGISHREAVSVITFGCRLNTVESETMRRAAIAGGHRDLVIVNTCAVTAEAVRQARQAIRRIARERPGARIAVTGCAAQTEPERFAAMAEVSHVLGNGEKTALTTWQGLAAPAFGLDASPKVLVNDIMSVRETAPQLLDGIEGRTRAFVQVQNGCDHRCTFCVIPYGRGPSRSVPMGVIVEQIQRLVDSGYREVVLTGVDITSYGGDLPGGPRLGALVQAILRHVPGVERLRLSSLDSVEMDPALLDAIGSERRIMPHLHLSLQAGDDLVLKRMKRRHSREDALRMTGYLRQLRPDIALGADLIAGFPTETEDMFNNTLRLIDDCGLAFVHVFPYSIREGTPAAKMPQNTPADIKDRARRLRAAAKTALNRHLARHVGREQLILVERDGFGRTEDFTQVLVPETESGGVRRARIVGHDGGALLGAWLGDEA